jgi:hypothetical protein
MKTIAVVTNSYTHFREYISRHIKDNEVYGTSIVAGLALVSYSNGSAARFRMINNLNNAMGIHWDEFVNLIDFYMGEASISSAEKALEYIEARYSPVSPPTEYPKSADEI